MVETMVMEVLKLVMPWLDSQELGKLAQTCRASGGAVRCLTECRVGDVTQGHETMAVPIVNDVDKDRYPNFYYTPFCQIVLSSKFSRTHWGFLESRRRKLTESEFGGAMKMGSVLLGVGCKCSDICTSSENGPPDDDEGQIALERHRTKRRRLLGCRCGRLVGGQTAYDQVSRLSHIEKLGNVQNTGTGLDHTRAVQCFRPGRTVPETEGKGSHELQNIIEVTGDPVQEQPEGTSSLIECGPACSCCSNCKYRVSQHGVSVKLKVVRTKRKGWSLCASQQINQGTFVCEYAGELITNAEARQRHMAYDSSRKSRDSQGSALLVLREHLPSGRASLRVNVDATRIGNVARFINHSCDGGNLLPCIIRQAGCPIPKLALFAMRSILDGEELTYSYGTGAKVVKYTPCVCGTSACFGALPSEMT